MLVSSDGNTGWDCWGKWWEKRDWPGGCQRAPERENLEETPKTTDLTLPTGWPLSRSLFCSYHYFCMASDPLEWTFTRGQTWWVVTNKMTPRTPLLTMILLQVLVTSLSLENIGYLEPANFWIGPSAVIFSEDFVTFLNV